MKIEKVKALGSSLGRETVVISVMVEDVLRARSSCVRVSKTVVDIDSPLVVVMGAVDEV